MNAGLARILFAGVLAFCALLCSSAQAPRAMIQVNSATQVGHSKESAP